MIWTFLKADPFFADFLPDIPNYKRKIMGHNTRGNPLTFTEEEKQRITDSFILLLENAKLPAIWKYIKAQTLFKEYLSHIKDYMAKVRGTNNRGNEVYFTTREKNQIKSAFYYLAEDEAKNVYSKAGLD